MSEVLQHEAFYIVIGSAINLYFSPCNIKSLLAEEVICNHYKTIMML